MRPLDVADYRSDWDCVVPMANLGAAKLDGTDDSNGRPTADWYVFLVAVVAAAVGAFVSNDILMAVAIVVGVSGLASAVCREIVHRRKMRKRHYDGGFLLRNDFLHSPDANVVFTDTVDAATELMELADQHPWMDAFVSSTDLNAACWQCAADLSARSVEQSASATRIRDNLRAARDDARVSVKELADRPALPAPSPTDVRAIEAELGSVPIDHSANLRDSLHSLAQGVSEISHPREGHYSD